MRIIVKSVSYNYDECTEYYKIVDITEEPYVAGKDEVIFHEIQFIKDNFAIYQKLRQLELDEIYTESYVC